MRQQDTSIALEIDATPAEAWKVIGAVGGVDQWFGSMIKSCSVEGNKRTCETADGAVLKEDILEVDHQNLTFRFAIPSQSILPVENIVEIMKVKSGNEGKALIEWSATFDATEDNGVMAKEAFQNLWTMGLKEMETYIRNSAN